MNRDDIRFVLLQQVPTFVICSLMLDGGGVLRTCLKALIVFWVFVGLSVVVMGEKHKLWRRWLVRWGFFPIFAVAWFVFPPEPLRVPVQRRGAVGEVDLVGTKTGRAGVPILQRMGSET